MNRRKAREYALQVLFQMEFAGSSADVALPDNLGKGAKDGGNDMRKFVDDLVRGTTAHLEEIDGVIRTTAENWDVKRMAAVDRNILRFAVYEILYRPDIPAAVTINEALEIAKKYSSLESVPFINGLLDKIAHDHAKA